jgi:hypothetical protein
VILCRIFHRWSEWHSEFEERPDGDMGVWEIRTRECRRKHCDHFEELTRCASASPVILRVGQYYTESW